MTPRDQGAGVTVADATALGLVASAQAAVITHYN